MATKLLRGNKVLGGVEQPSKRVFYVAWMAPPGKARDPAADCADLLAGDLEAYPDDFFQRPIGSVKLSAAGQQDAGGRVAPIDQVDWTDYIALLSTSFAKAHMPKGSQFATVIDMVNRAGPGGVRGRAVWTVVVEPCLWKHFVLGGYRLGQVLELHAEDKEISSSTAARKKDITRVIERLLGHDPAHCPHCSGA